ncbi:Prefoldin subunit 2 [Cricetulus griseus]|uniref:Prefoldin subunit 2 n=1 Tax=Cricetulus griseus TaxID=10029 RepID=G3HU10_CRIGR|nr:Prefoldin subunit 2 [Cricetulus griseus]
MADSSGRVSKSSGSSTGKGAVSAEQVSIRERRGQLGRCRVRAGNGVCGLYRPSALSTFSVSHSRREAITTPARACGGGCAEESHVRRLQREPSGKALSCGSWEGVQGPKVIAGFNRLRQEQRGLASKAAELEMELNEHSLVIDTLKEVDETRRCYRMVGGVLVERTVKEVLPALEGNKEQIQKIIETLSQQLQAKGKELNEFREKHNIRLMGEDEKPAAKENSEGPGAKSSSAGVLVS